MKIKLILEYDGRNFHGWQRQNSLDTVQGHLEDSLLVYVNSLIKKHALETGDNLQAIKKINITGSGRTDAGVSAYAQVASFSWKEDIPFEKKSFIKSLNGITRNDVSILDAELVEDHFDARRSAHSKEYFYTISFRATPHAILRDRILHIPGIKVSSMQMESLIRIFEGTHDFASFRASDCSAKTTCRTILSTGVTVNRDGSCNLHFHGNGFLKNMIRIIVGDIVYCCRKKMTEDQIKKLLSGEKREKAALCVSAYPLVLNRVMY